jgi:hypothetical protein
VQLAAIGADPQLALSTGTFAPGDVTDATGAGNSCDDIVDEGCIVAQNLLVEDASADEIDAAVSAGGATVSNGTATATGSASSATETAAADDGKSRPKAQLSRLITTNMFLECDNEDSATATATASAAASASATGTATSSGGVDVNAFTGSTGAAPVPVVSSAASDRPFSVNGDTFINAGAAIQRACDVQKNQCANAVNSGGSGSVSDCDAQQQECIAANNKKKRSARARAFPRY